MKKIELDVDGLTVESFPTTAPEPQERGTVEAQGATLIRCGTGVASCYTSCRADLRDACTCPV